ncbi:putative D-lactate dehydrogenase, mitochondrial [Saccoglossus kowalevskii]|uniref:D-lactate dehydrogenase (cytochrome) n=1 Tax=Saccoglossus kowalevskii TaxID=10224 RepID=A0ABM0MIF3_SACKO|nr:PREDICTED: probable D-lactate dehydrogenase, mitochondrial-like [Saccoglossus kowalevskii]
MDYTRASGYYHHIAGRKGPPVPKKNVGQDNQGFHIPQPNVLAHQTETPESRYNNQDDVTEAFTMGRMIPPMTTAEFRLPQIGHDAVSSQPRPGKGTLPPEFDENMIDLTSKALMEKVLKEHKSHDMLEECLIENGRKMYDIAYQRYGSHHENVCYDAMLDNLVMTGEQALLDGQFIPYTSVEFLDESGEADTDCPTMRKGKALLTNQRLLLLSAGETADLSLYKLQKAKSTRSYSNKYSVETFCGDNLHLKTLPIEGFLSVDFHSSIGSKIRSCMKHWNTDPLQVTDYNDRYVTIGALVPPWAKRTMVNIHFDPAISYTLISHFLLEMQSHASNDTSNVPSEVIKSFRSLLGSSNVSTSLSVREHHGKDESYHTCILPDVVVWPGSTTEVSEVMKICYENDIPMVPFGTGTGLEGAVNGIEGSVCINVTKMDAIIELNRDDFDVTVQPGVTRKMLNKYLRDQGLWFPIDPGADASICGMCATSASGTNAVRYGTMRENVMNLQVVLADGTIINTAGEGKRTRKTSAGYNLTNLFVGSEGTLGIITMATIRLHGIPEAMVSAVCSFKSVHAAVETVTQVMQCGIPIARIEFMDSLTMEACNKYSELNYNVAPTLFLEFHGTERMIEEQAMDVGELVYDNGGSDFKWAKDIESRNKLWAARHDAWFASLALRPGSKGMPTDVCVPISKLPEIIDATREDIEKSSLIGPICGHVGDGNFHVILLIDPNDEEEFRKAKEVATKIARHAISLGGTCTGEHGIGLGKKALLVEEIGETGIAAMKQIKFALDHKNLMNPGKVL